MKRISMILGFLGTMAIAATAATVLGNGSAALETVPPDSEVEQILEIDGYPLDRSLKAMVEYHNLDLVVLLTSVEAGTPRWNTPTGAVPTFIAEKRAPTEAEGQRNPKIVTPISAKIESVVYGSYRNKTLGFTVVGGQVDKIQMNVGDSYAPPVTALTKASTLLVGGYRDAATKAFEPVFVFQVSESGALRSLLAGLDGEYSTGQLASLQEDLSVRASSDEQ